MNFCPNCGNRLQPNLRFCTNCGAEVNTAVPPATTGTPTPITAAPAAPTTTAKPQNTPTTISAAPTPITAAPVAPTAAPAPGYAPAPAYSPAPAQYAQANNLMFSLNCTKTRGIKFDYVFMLFYPDRLAIINVPSKQLEKDLYAERKNRKIKFTGLMAFRKEFLENYANGLRNLGDSQILAMNGDNAVVYYAQMQKPKFHFMSTHRYESDEDVTTSTTAGGLSFTANGRKFKYQHNYGYSSQMSAQIAGIYGGIFKIYK